MTFCTSSIKSAILPRPEIITEIPGENRLQSDLYIFHQGPGARAVAELLAEYLRPATGFACPVLALDPSDSSKPKQGHIRLICQDKAVEDEAGFVDETYRLNIDNEINELEATNATGLARGIQTLRQCLPPEVFSNEVQNLEWTLKRCRIEDKPRFRWRGQHLDVSRYFFSVEDVCRFIELLAIHRLNICHLHLTDDQGWRIEIKKYPKLTQIGAEREETLIGHEHDRPRRYDGQAYGGFYSQEDIKSIVEFAQKRHITILPEIDMPGHMMAAISAYPELGNFEMKSRVRCHWGISHNTINMEASTIDFMKDVLDEVMDLFPGRFIHLGGDEAPKKEWSESERAQRRMLELGLKSEDQLQAWFIQEMGAHVEKRGKRFIGWDEILEGGLAKGAALMSWHDESGGITASKLGHDVVMAPSQHLYFDHYQSSPMSEEPLAIHSTSVTHTGDVYAYDPIPTCMDAEQAEHVLGGQGQLWTEYIPNMKHLEYMGFPRICALSEALWLSKGEKNYLEFLERLNLHRLRLKAMNVNAHPLPR